MGHLYEAKHRGRSVATEWQVLESVCLPLKGHIRKRRREPVDKQRDVAFTKRHNYRGEHGRRKTVVQNGNEWKSDFFANAKSLENLSKSL